MDINFSIKGIKDSTLFKICCLALVALVVFLIINTYYHSNQDIKYKTTEEIEITSASKP